MVAVLVTVTLDLFDGSQSQYMRGSTSWVPSQVFPDVADQQTIGQSPVVAYFSSGSLPQIKVIANDTAGPQGQSSPGWTWNVTYSPDTLGAPAAASYYVLSTNGLTQRLSSLVAVPAAQPGSLTVPGPLAAPTAVGQTLAVSQASPLVTRWVRNRMFF